MVLCGPLWSFAVFSQTVYLDTISYRYYNQLISRTDLSPIPVRSAAKSYITSWCIQNIQNLSKRVLNRQTVSTSTTKFLLMIPKTLYASNRLPVSLVHGLRIRLAVCVASAYNDGLYVCWATAHRAYVYMIDLALHSPIDRESEITQVRSTSGRVPAVYSCTVAAFIFPLCVHIA